MDSDCTAIVNIYFLISVQYLESCTNEETKVINLDIKY